MTVSPAALIIVISMTQRLIHRGELRELPTRFHESYQSDKCVDWQDCQWAPTVRVQLTSEGRRHRSVD